MVKKLNFKEDCGRWESEEFQVSGDFNLHVERKGGKLFSVMQKTAGSRYANVLGAGAYVDASVVDVDVQVLVPKTFKVISHSQVTDAYITEGV